ncbi:MAG TPA: hypothetical protein VKQ30_25000 [Ktedonobacterales bacterium]|nr:hypothetical protein [Ktedonobacterales bacterium]
MGGVRDPYDGREEQVWRFDPDVLIERVGGEGTTSRILVSIAVHRLCDAFARRHQDDQALEEFRIFYRQLYARKNAQALKLLRPLLDASGFGYRAEMEVYHAQYGYGRILAIQDDGMVAVRFEKLHKADRIWPFLLVARRRPGGMINVPSSVPAGQSYRERSGH